MENLDHELVKIHQEALHAEADTHRAIQESGMNKPPTIDRTLDALGDVLIRLGTRLKDHSSVKLTTQEDNTHNFMIIL